MQMDTVKIGGYQFPTKTTIVEIHAKIPKTEVTPPSFTIFHNTGAWRPVVTRGSLKVLPKFRLIVVDCLPIETTIDFLRRECGVEVADNQPPILSMVIQLSRNRWNTLNGSVSDALYDFVSTPSKTRRALWSNGLYIEGQILRDLSGGDMAISCSQQFVGALPSPNLYFQAGPSSFLKLEDGIQIRFRAVHSIWVYVGKDINIVFMEIYESEFIALSEEFANLNEAVGDFAPKIRSVSLCSVDNCQLVMMISILRAHDYNIDPFRFYRVADELVSYGLYMNPQLELCSVLALETESDGKQRFEFPPTTDDDSGQLRCTVVGIGGQETELRITKTAIIDHGVSTRKFEYYCEESGMWKEFLYSYGTARQSSPPKFRVVDECFDFYNSYIMEKLRERSDSSTFREEKDTDGEGTSSSEETSTDGSRSDDSSSSPHVPEKRYKTESGDTEEIKVDDCHDENTPQPTTDEKKKKEKKNRGLGSSIVRRAGVLKNRLFQKEEKSAKNADSRCGDNEEEPATDLPSFFHRGPLRRTIHTTNGETTISSLVRRSLRFLPGRRTTRTVETEAASIEEPHTGMM